MNFNSLSIIGTFPSISAIIYLWFMVTKDIIKFKLLIIFIL